MEKIRSRTKGTEMIQGYTPYWDIPQRELKNRKWEIVCFLYPYCDGTCAHCWSSQIFLGRVMPIEWHEIFWQRVDGSKIKEIRFRNREYCLCI